MAPYFATAVIREADGTLATGRQFCVQSEIKLCLSATGTGVGQVMALWDLEAHPEVGPDSGETDPFKKLLTIPPDKLIVVLEGGYYTDLNPQFIPFVTIRPISQDMTYVRVIDPMDD